MQVPQSSVPCIAIFYNKTPFTQKKGIWIVAAYNNVERKDKFIIELGRNRRKWDNDKIDLQISEKHLIEWILEVQGYNWSVGTMLVKEGKSFVENGNKNQWIILQDGKNPAKAVYRLLIKLCWLKAWKRQNKKVCQQQDRRLTTEDK